jgi:hypothetical protein
MLSQAGVYPPAAAPEATRACSYRKGEGWNFHNILKFRLDNAQYIVISIYIFKRADVFRFLGF